MRCWPPTRGSACASGSRSGRASSTGSWTFAPVFAEGGFNLQVGNPPWVRPDWDDALVLAEDDAWFGLADKPSVVSVRERREQVLDDGDVRYLDERASLAGTSAHLGSAVDRPLLRGTQPDLYRCFMDRTWRSIGAAGVVGLIHPESHFTEVRAAGLRRETYQRLRRRWQFRNVFKKLFVEIDNGGEFSVSIYGPSRAVSFMSASSLYWPDVVDRSLQHDGSGAEPGLRNADASWDLRAHRARIIEVDEGVLADWAALIDEPGTPPLEARLLRPVNRSSQGVLDKLAAAPRFGEVSFDWTAGWHESADKAAGYFVGRSAVPDSPGRRDPAGPAPHRGHAVRAAAQPDHAQQQGLHGVGPGSAGGAADPAHQLPARQADPRLHRRLPALERRTGQPVLALAWRNMVDSSTVRSLHAALIPPGPMHVHVVHTLTAPSVDLAVAAGCGRPCRSTSSSRSAVRRRCRPSSPRASPTPAPTPSSPS